MPASSAARIGLLNPCRTLDGPRKSRPWVAPNSVLAREFRPEPGALRAVDPAIAEVVGRVDTARWSRGAQHLCPAGDRLRSGKPHGDRHKPLLLRPHAWINQGVPALLRIANDWFQYAHYHRSTDLPQNMTIAQPMAEKILRTNVAGVATWTVLDASEVLTAASSRTDASTAIGRRVRVSVDGQAGLPRPGELALPSRPPPSTAAACG